MFSNLSPQKQQEVLGMLEVMGVDPTMSPPDMTHEEHRQHFIDQMAAAYDMFWSRIDGLVSHFENMEHSKGLRGLEQWAAVTSAAMMTSVSPHGRSDKDSMCSFDVGSASAVIPFTMLRSMAMFAFMQAAHVTNIARAQPIGDDPYDVRMKVNADEEFDKLRTMFIDGVADSICKAYEAICRGV